MESNHSLPEKVLEHIRLTDVALQKAAALEKSWQEMQQKRAALIPQVVEELVKHQRIRPDQREKMAQQLQDPVRALELMARLAGHRNEEELQRLGRGVASGGAQKQASSGKSPRVRQSTVVLFERLGLTPPEED